MNYSKKEQIEVLTGLIEKYTKHKEMLKESSDVFYNEIINLDIAIDGYSKAKTEVEKEDWLEASKQIEKANLAIAKYVEDVDLILDSLNKPKTGFIN